MGDLSWRFDHKEYKYVKEVLDSGFASGTSGNMNARLEKEFARKFNTKFAITASSGTTTLHAALWALGVRYGDEVIVTPLTVISCMNAILYCNAIPVFADIDPETFNIDPESIRKCITPKTKAIMTVHLYGQVCNMTEIMKIAKEHKLAVLEDCAQCYLGTHKGKIEGSFGDIASWSFENSKHITTGDGGILTCNDEKIGDNLRRLTCQGFRNATAISGKIRVSKDLFQNPNYKRHSQFGFMYRLPEIAAAMGLAQIEKLDWFVGLRIKMAKMYREVIKDTGCNWIKPQKTPDGDINSSYAFAATLENNKVSWEEFRLKFIENGGDGFYAAWALLYQEDSIKEIKSLLKLIGLNDRLNTEKGICPNAERVQKKIMQFTTNQKDENEMKIQADALRKTINYYS
jgi:perosamine synthetase